MSETSRAEADDAAVIGRSRQEPEAFAEVFRRYAPDIKRYVTRRLKAADAGRELAGAGLVPAAVHTSELRRAIDTASEVAGVTGGHPATRRSWRLNERHYGAWQGRSRRDVLAEVGEEYFIEVPRGWSARPPAGEMGSGAEYPELRRPGVTAESLADVWTRLQPYWRESIKRDLTAGAVVLVVAHGNSLRALVKHLDGLGEAELGSFELAVGSPRCTASTAPTVPMATRARCSPNSDRASATWIDLAVGGRVRRWAAWTTR
jgi:2,3-bisphosphoglycerate-dependent phosphoglycerate mutase